MSKPDSNLFDNTIGDSVQVKLPEKESQIKHIFRDTKGHLKDTPRNRRIIEELAQDNSHFCGTDKYGNKWNVKITKERKSALG